MAVVSFIMNTKGLWGQVWGCDCVYMWFLTENLHYTFCFHHCKAFTLFAPLKSHMLESFQCRVLDSRCWKENYLQSPAMNDDNNHFFSSFLLGILHKGNGENQFLTQQPAVITSIMGNGRRRSISCPSCNGLAEGNKLLAPVALAVGIDGSLFVGDFNYIRRIFPSRNVTSILELR